MNLLQSPAYGLAVADIKNQKLRWGVIELDGREAGYVQLLETNALNKLLQALTLDRGPLWFDGYGSFEHFEAFLQAFRREFPPRIGRAVRFIPEIEASETIEALFTQHKFRKKAEKYQTIWVDLTQSVEVLRANLKGNWRGKLNKAEKSGMTVDWDMSAQHLDWFLKHYSVDKKTKGYAGPSVELMKRLAENFLPEGGLIIGRAVAEGRAVAAILLFCHGRTATYQIGWSTQAGRKAQAHNLLLWEALLFLKTRGMTALDLGGVNEEDAKNVKIFKEGMGGRLVTLAGLYT